MGSPGKRQNKRQRPCTRYSNEDIILNRYDEYISPKAVARKCALSRFLPCGIARCRLFTCSLSTQWRKRQRTPTPTAFGQHAQPQTLSKLASLRFVETTVQNGFWRET